MPKGTYTAYRAAYLENLSETVRMKETDGDDFVIADGELIGYMGDSTEVTIPESVTKIGNLAFAKDADSESDDSAGSHRNRRKCIPGQYCIWR